MNNFEKAEVSLRYWLIGRGYIQALKAMEFGKRYHKGLRKDGVTPEFHHQISIAQYVRTLPNLIDMERTLCVVFLSHLKHLYAAIDYLLINFPFKFIDLF